MKHEMGEQEEFSIQELDSSVAFVRPGMRNQILRNYIFEAF